MNATDFGNNAFYAQIVIDENFVEFLLQHRDSGKTWKSPLLSFDVHDKLTRRTETVQKYRVDEIDTTESGAQVRISDAWSGVRLGLWLEITDAGLRVILQPAEVYEDKQDILRLFAIDLLPGLIRAGREGQLLLPINSGALCSPADKPALEDRFLIYGEQERWELLPLLPVCAAKDPDGGLCAVATSGACDMQCRVTTDGEGNGWTGFAATFRRHWPDPVDVSERIIDITLIGKQDDLVVSAAQRVRAHLVDDWKKPTLKQRIAESPEVAYLHEAYVMKLFHGMENRGFLFGESNTDKNAAASFISCLTFDEAAACLTKLKQAGVEKIHTQSVGWNPRGHDGLYPTRFPVERRLGGEAGFRRMADIGCNKLGYNINVHDNFGELCAASPDTNLDRAVQDIYGEPLKRGFWGGGLSYMQWPLAFPTDEMLDSLRRVQGLGTRGMYYLDGMFTPLEVNYHPHYGGTRADCARGERRYVETARSVFGACGSECGFLYGAVACDMIVTGGDAWHLDHWVDSWAITKLVDRLVPVWRIAFSGLLMLEQHGINWHAAMSSVLFAKHPRDEWSARPGIMPVLDDKRIAAQKAVYDICIKRFGYLETEEIVAYREPAENVKETEFSDGSKVTADFAKGELMVNGEQIGKPDAL